MPLTKGVMRHSIEWLMNELLGIIGTALLLPLFILLPFAFIYAIYDTFMSKQYVIGTIMILSLIGFLLLKISTL